MLKLELAVVRTLCAILGMFVIMATQAMAAGDGTGIQDGFTEVGTDLNTLLNGAGGYILIIVAIGIGVAMIAFGKGFGAAISAFVVALVLGYGVDALTGMSGVTANTNMVSIENAADGQPTPNVHI